VPALGWALMIVIALVVIVFLLGVF
jgi:hypothetical protein